MRTYIRTIFLILVAVLCLILVLRFVAGSTHADNAFKATTKNESEAHSVAVTEKTVDDYSESEESVTIQSEEAWEYSISQEEIDLIALITMGEAEGESDLGKRLVIDTILNRMDDSQFPNTVYDVIYYPNAFSVVWNGRLERCYVMPEIVELVKEELLDRTNYDCLYFCSSGYSKYGTPLFKEDHHYFSGN